MVDLTDVRTLRPEEVADALNWQEFRVRCSPDSTVERTTLARIRTVAVLALALEVEPLLLIGMKAIPKPADHPVEAGSTEEEPDGE